MFAFEPNDYRIKAKQKIIEIGDIHGDIDALYKILYKSGVISKSGQFIGENMDIVFLGDLVGSGQYSVRVLNLVAWLKQNAIQNRSRVHLLLGNHELRLIKGYVRSLSFSDVEALSGFKGTLKDALRRNPTYQKLFTDSRAILNLITESGEVHWYVHGSVNKTLKKTPAPSINKMVYDWVQYYIRDGKKPKRSTSWVLESTGPMEDRTLHNRKLRAKAVKSWFADGQLPTSINLGHTPTASGLVESWRFGNIVVNALDTSISRYKRSADTSIIFRIREKGKVRDVEIKRPKLGYAERHCQVLQEALGID